MTPFVLAQAAASPEAINLVPSMWRMAGGLLSVISVGLGLLWAVFDEDRLTWHDHVSRTFPTIRYRL